MASLGAIDYKNVQSGLICQGAVSEMRMPLDAVTECVNMHFDRVGAATLRKGLTALGSDGVLSGQCLGLFEFRDSGAGTNNRIIAVFGTAAYYLSGSTWTSKRTGLTASSKAEFTTFLDFVWMVNGADATAIWSGASGDSFVTTGNAASAPTGKYIENFRSRVWIAGNSTYPDRLYYSSLPSAVTTPIVTWDTDVNTGDWIDISPSDGENITGLIRDINSLLVFKQNHLYRVYTVSEVEPDPKINVGTYSGRSIVSTKQGIFFHHPSGFYQYAGGAVKEISRPIIDFVEAITAANYTEITGWEDGDHVYWSIGDVTVNGIAYTKIVVRYTISTQVWTTYSYPTQFYAASPYNDGTTLFHLVGDSAGKVYKVNVGNLDDATAINYTLVHRWYQIDGLSATEKTISMVAFSHTGGAKTTASYQVENSALNDWTRSLGEFKQYDTLLKDNQIKGRKCRLRINGVSRGEPFTYNGFEFLDAQAKPYNG